MSAADELTKALLTLAERGQRVRCCDGETSSYWLSEDTDERAIAAKWCSNCPIISECEAAANETKATFGVWAGVDRTVQPRASKRRATKTERKQSA